MDLLSVPRGLSIQPVPGTEVEWPNREGWFQRVAGQKENKIMEGLEESFFFFF